MRSTQSLRAIRSLVIVLAAFACLALAPSVGRAAVAQWIGGATGTWNTPTAWSGGVVPNNTQSITYIAQVAQAFGAYATVTINNTTPTVSLDRLSLTPTGAVNIANGATLNLRDLGAGSTLQRSLVGGGTLQIATGGTLAVGLNGGVISGDANVQMNGGRIAGTGRIENAKFLSGTGTIGRSSATATDSALLLYNVGNATNPTATRITADRNGQSLTLNLGDGLNTDTVLLHRYATMSAINGGKLVIRTNRGLFLIDNATVDAGAGSEIELGGETSVGNGAISGAGTLRITGQGNGMTYTQVNVAKTLIEGELGLYFGASLNGATDLSGTLDGDFPSIKATASVRMLPTAASANPRIQGNNAGTLGISNYGAITGAGTIAGNKLVNAGSITATIPGTPLVLDITGSGIDLGSTGTLVGNGGVLSVGKFGSTSPVTGSGSANIVANQGGVVDLYSPVTLPSAAVVNNGGMTINNTTKFKSISGAGIATVNASLEMSQLRSRLLAQGPTKLLANGGVSRSTQLAISSSGSLDLTNNPLVLDYATGNSPLIAMNTAIKAGRLKTTAAGFVIGIADAAALGSPTSWNGETIDSTTVLILPTFAGDANLDRAVDFNDLVQLAQRYNLTGTWSDGDFDYSGTVDFNDLVAMAQKYNSPAAAGAITNAGGDFAGDWALAQSLAPEPASLFAIAAASLLMRRRQ